MGDEKQSIYRFRGADVRVLKQLQRQLEESGGEALQLPNNYRSHSGLIRFFNTLFAEVMQPVGGQPAGAASVGNWPIEAPEAVGSSSSAAGRTEIPAAGVGSEAEFIPSRLRSSTWPLLLPCGCCTNLMKRMRQERRMPAKRAPSRALHYTQRKPRPGTSSITSRR
ncbi:MAG: UvrD-helicase domain-containing protein [Spirochaetia bacterium]|nr:UvrD-helicase domain-containing protein [Spirochaetia bacterium]